METEAKTTGWKKIGLMIAGALVVFGVGYYAWAWNYFFQQAPERTGKDMTYMWQWELYGKGMKLAYEQDTYGGVTPEETLALFVDALEAGNIELAAKYYIPEKQGEAYAELLDGEKNGTLLKTADVYSSAAFPKQTAKNEYFMSVSGDGYSFDIILNRNVFSQKWKIASP